MIIQLTVLSTILTVVFWAAGAAAVVIIGACVLPSVIRQRPRPARRLTAPIASVPEPRRPIRETVRR